MVTKVNQISDLINYQAKSLSVQIKTQTKEPETSYYSGKIKLSFERKIEKEMKKLVEEKWSQKLIPYKLETEWAFLKNHYLEETSMEHQKW